MMNGEHITMGDGSVTNKEERINRQYSRYGLSNNLTYSDIREYVK